MSVNQELSLSDVLNFIPLFGDIRRLTYREITRIGDTEYTTECDIDYSGVSIRIAYY